MARAVLVALIVVALVALPAWGQQARVFRTDSEPSSIADPFAGPQGGARAAGADLLQKFRQRCPSVVAEREAEKADYVLAVEQEGGRNPLKRDTQVTVFDRQREMIHSSSAIRLASALDGACSAIRIAWANKVWRETHHSPREDPGAEPAEPSPAKPAEPKRPSVAAESPPELPGYIGAAGQGDGVHGVTLISLDPEGPAVRAGLQVGDLIQRVDGKRVTSARRLASEVARRRPGSTLRLYYLRDGRPAEALVTIEEAP